MSKMFSFITETWNPMKGCKHDCIYCWARDFAEGRLKKISAKYKDGFTPRFFEDELKRKFKPGDSVFVCDMGDLFGEWVPREWIEQVLEHIKKFPNTTFLLLTKNPSRYLEFEIPTNCLAGATIESNRNYPTFSKAPPQSERLEAMQELGHPKKFLCSEPLFNFDLRKFFVEIVATQNLKHIAIGYDNYNNNLPEPPLKKTLELIKLLEEGEIDVIRKTLREAVP